MLGKIKSARIRRQILDMSKLKWGNVTPTDLDIVLEFRHKLLIIGELKFHNTVRYEKVGDRVEFTAGVQRGQMLAIERICDSWHFDTFNDVQRFAYGVLLEHNVRDTNKEIQAHRTIVMAYYDPLDSCWKETESIINFKRFIDKMRSQAGLD